MSEPQPTADLRRTHRLCQAASRDPHEHGRTATPLELLYDLVFVVAIGQAASQFAHVFAEGHVAAATGAFLFAMLWAWISYSWFSSAFDTDNWVHHLATMVQMVGATIMALGLPVVFHSIDAGDHLDNTVVVAGYVVMRIAMVFLWLRAARHGPQHRATCMTYVWTIVIAQVGWVATALLSLSLLQGLTAVVLVSAPLLALAGVPAGGDGRAGGQRHRLRGLRLPTRRGGAAAGGEGLIESDGAFPTQGANSVGTPAGLGEHRSGVRHNPGTALTRSTKEWTSMGDLAVA